MLSRLKPKSGAGFARRGTWLALASAALFGASTPLAKLLLGSVDPWLLAGLLYLGAGIGLAVLRTAQRVVRRAATREASLGGAGWVWLAGAVAAGGIVGPVLLMLGLARTTAATASLLLNIEAVLTVALAWAAFGEPLGRRFVLAMVAIVAGAVVLSWPDDMTLVAGLGPLAVAAACLAWAVDNNLTRKISLHDPLEIATVKGLVAGAVNVGLAFVVGAAMPEARAIAAAGVVGLIGYGLSLVLFVGALRELGAARTGAYFAVAPFVGAAIAAGALGEAVGIRFGLAGLLMAFGVWLNLGERHEHEHEHEPIVHSHQHWHDEHHKHAHAPDDPPGEPHGHPHAHERARHAHPHQPDAHHRHRH